MEELPRARRSKGGDLIAFRIARAISDRPHLCGRLLILAKGWEARPEAIGHSEGPAQRGETNHSVVRWSFSQHIVRDLGNHRRIR